MAHHVIDEDVDPTFKRLAVAVTWSQPPSLIPKNVLKYLQYDLDWQ